MIKNTLNRHSLEILEARIAPASVPLGAQWLQASHSADGSPIVLRAGQGLSTGGLNDGDYLLYLEKGNALIFTTDFNNNSLVDFNEITGIAAGNGMRLISFVDIHGDIATNLKETVTSAGVLFSLSDSNNNPSDDNSSLRGDGRVILNNRIESIELRTLTTADITDQNQNQIIDQIDVDLRRAPTTHSIFGNVYAGGGFGVPEDPTSGLLIDTTTITNFGYEGEVRAMIGSIRVGTAVSGGYFSFGIKGQYETSGGVMSQRVRAGVVIGDDTQGYIVPFVPSPGQAGASIAHVRSALPTQFFNLNGLYAGDGGANAAGGNISDVVISGDDAGGYDIVAGKGGDGTRGGAGGSILRFSDLASDTSEVIIQSGSGGNGSATAGGNAGNMDIIAANFYGNYSIVLGSGGDGFTQGGVGASLTRAVITQPISIGETAGTAWGTSHNPSYYNPDPTTHLDADGNPKFQAHFGTQQSFDIDGDGMPDFVFSTNDVSQLVVMFGDPLFPGSFRIEDPLNPAAPARIYLDSPRNAEAVTVADLDGDGRPDIAAASSDLGNQSGIAVYLSKWNDVNADGDVLDVEDQFLGFHSPRYSTLPQIETGDATTSNFKFGFWLGTGQVSQLVAGDFDGDGANELAAVVTHYSLIKNEVNGVITGYNSPLYQVLMFLSPDRELDTSTGKTFLTGQFYADFGTKRVTTATQDAPAEPWRPFFILSDSGPGTIFIEATALSGTADHDVVIASQIGARTLRVIDYFDRAPVIPAVATPPLALGAFDLGQVDTDRRNGEVNPTRIGMLDFAMMDFDGDDLVDAVVVSDGPANFVVGIKGNGLGSGTQDSGNGSDQSGYLVEPGNARGVRAYGGADFALLVDAVPGFGPVVQAYDYLAGPQTGASGPTPGLILTYDLDIGPTVGSYHNGSVTDQVMWDVYLDTAVIGAVSSYNDLVSAGLYSEPWAEPQLNIFAGDGGNSFVGKAGNGGLLGGKGKFETIVDPLTNISFTDFAGAIEIQFEGVVTLLGGDGGLGFSRGGNGGSISGVSLRDPDLTNNILPVGLILAGDGGRGVSGTGGSGGDLIANSILNGVLFTAGMGGDGKFGGRGGAVIGNGLKIGTTRVYDTATDFLEVYAGTGGNGIRSGGAGGSIVNFRPTVQGDSGDVLDAGSMSYVAGHGGNAVSGTGGAGGSVVNSSPELNGIIEDQIFIEAGRGGDGRTGGAGGSVTTFAVTQSTNPVKIVHILAGHGGSGTAGPGGRGGNISAIDVKSQGTTENVFFTSPGSALFTYSRMLAGDGGASFGARGGDGGTISNLVTGAIDGTIAIVGGAGGDGLSQGGLGGSVTNTLLAALGAGSNSKALVIAGAGGDARAFIPNPLDTTPDQAKKAFGGRVGVGGHGGSINGFTQQGDAGTHLDFIAGNGGSTINYGTVVDKKPFVGRGGSVMNVRIEGTAGNYDPQSPIKGYNDILNGETIQDFVENRLRVGQAIFETLGDGDGNVGIVVGSAGRNKAVRLDPLGAPYDYIDQPATNAKNGDLINFRAFAIMSAVAGSVDRLAAIQLAKGIVVNGTLVGQDKDVVGEFEYWNTRHDEVLANPVRDGGLIDGAFIAKSIQQPAGLSLIGRVYSF